MSHRLHNLVPGKDVGLDHEDGAKALHRPRKGMQHMGRPAVSMNMDLMMQRTLSHPCIP
jgi:hypothetical protein